jgi:YmgG-like glycine-zipper protein
VNGDRKEGLGKNERTGKYVGGGAVLGAIIGAITGGGKGAAIGAGAGAAAGAGVQVLTRGKSVDVPSESLLTFRLSEPLRAGLQDRGSMRNGHHYHPNAARRSDTDNSGSR